MGMSYRTKTLIKAVIGLAVMAGLGLFAYYGLYAEHRTEQREQTFARLALDLDKARVKRIELTGLPEKVVLERSGVGDRDLPSWRMLAPVEAEADDMAVNGLLGVFDLMDAERRLALAEVPKLEQFGLDPPALTWTLVMDDGERIGLQVGRKSPFNEQLYLRRVGADEIMLVKGSYIQSLSKDAFALRRKELLRVEPDRVQAIRLTTPPHPAASAKPRVRIELERRDAAWFMTAPLEDRADPGEVRKLLNTMRNLRAKAFPGDKVADKYYGLDPAGWEVTLLSGSDRIASTVHLGRGQLPSNRGKLFARVTQPEGPLARVPAYVLSIVDKTPFDLQAKAPVVFDPAQAARIKLAREAELLVLQRSRSASDGGPGARDSWALVSPVAGAAKNYRVQALLAALNRLKATRFEGQPDPANLARTGLERPDWTVVVEGENGEQLARLQIGRAGPDGTYVRGDAREPICLVPTAALASVTARQSDLIQSSSGSSGAEKP